jgi:integrase
MANAKKLPSGRWRVRVYEAGTGKRTSFTADSKKQAELLAMEYLNGLAPTQKDETTIGEYIERYIQSKTNILSPSSIESYWKIKRNLLTTLCDLTPSELTQEVVQKHFNELSLNRAPKTVRNAHAFLVGVLNVYCPDIHLRTALPKLQKQIKQLPSVQDILSVITGTEIELPCLMALWLGMRMSEIRGARFEDITDGVLTIKNVVVTVQGEHIEKTQTKTYDSTRQIRLPDYILNLIESLPRTDKHIITLSGQAIYKRFMRLLKNNDIPHISFHDLRHLNASTMLALGVPDKYAMERGGWASTNIMKSVYQHTLTAQRKVYDDVIDDYFSKKLDTKLDTDNNK